MVVSKRIKYDDFEIEDDYKSYLFEVSCQFVQNFYDSYPRWGPLQIPGTNRQAGSALWFAERQFRITASVCKRVMLLGENLEPQRCYSWLQHSFWFKQTFTTPDMQYGITEEVNAIASYTKATGNEGHPERFMGTKKVHLPRSEPRRFYFRQFC